MPVSPSGVVNLTNDLVVANVSSKSRTVIPLLGLLTDLENAIALGKAFLSLVDFENANAFPSLLLTIFFIPALVSKVLLCGFNVSKVLLGILGIALQLSFLLPVGIFILTPS